MILYPVLNKVYFHWRSSASIRAYYRRPLSDDEQEKILEEGKKYNDFLANLIKSRPVYPIDEIQDYYAENGPQNFHPFETIGIIEIPKINVKLPLRAGTHDRILHEGAGWLIESSLPIGGPNTHSIITAHRGSPEGKLFQDLDQLEIGDRIYLDSVQEIKAYEVEEIKIIDPTDFDEFKIVDNQDYLTLLTCHPPVVHSHRMIVRCRATATEGDEIKIKKDRKKEIITGGILLVLGITYVVKKREVNNES